MTTVELNVQGMHCGGCVKRVTLALLPLPGVSGVDVNLAAARVSVVGSFAQGAQALALALTVAGYPATLADGAAAEAEKSGSCCG